MKTRWRIERRQLFEMTAVPDMPPAVAEM
jgi:hypothetical protein